MNNETPIILCDECGGVCDSADSVATDVGLAFCGSHYGNGCAEKIGA